MPFDQLIEQAKMFFEDAAAFWGGFEDIVKGFATFGEFEDFEKLFDENDGLSSTLESVSSNFSGDNGNEGSALSSLSSD